MGSEKDATEKKRSHSFETFFSKTDKTEKEKNNGYIYIIFFPTFPPAVRRDFYGQTHFKVRVRQISYVYELSKFVTSALIMTSLPNRGLDTQLSQHGGYQTQAVFLVLTFPLLVRMTYPDGSTRRRTGE